MLELFSIIILRFLRSCLRLVSEFFLNRKNVITILMSIELAAFGEYQYGRLFGLTVI